MHATDRKRPADLQVVDALLEEWGEESFPASDPPGCLPPSVQAIFAELRPPEAEEDSDAEGRRPDEGTEPD